VSTIKVPLDFDGIEDFDNIPAGVYPAVIEKLTYRPAKEASESQDGKAKSASVSVEYTVTDPEYEGRKLWQNLYFTPKAMWRAARFFKVFGEDYRELDVDEETGIVLSPSLGGIAVEVKTYVDGDWGNKVDDPPVPLGKAAQRSTTSSRKAAASDEEDAGEAEPAQKRRGGRAIR